MLYVLVPSGHRLSSREAVSAADLLDEGFILEKTQCALRVLGQAGFAFGESKPAIRYEARDSATVLAMVREGLGITLAPRQMLPARLEDVRALRLDPPHPLRLGLAYKERATLSRAARLFVEAAALWAEEQRLTGLPLR